ncbi:TonB-dependent receptor [Burkholderiaceae bacterium DAT-1]|nr:TonB-dependent receptor [Burkholderiaceae bacterium DAT-1]
MTLALCAITLPAVAEIPASTPNVQTVDTIEVIARPIVEDIRLDAFSGTSAVVSDKQLRDQNAVDAASALRRTPGVQISRYNPVGAFGGDQGGAVFIRGMGVSRPGSEIKTYIDGVPFYMGLWNHPLLDLLPINGMQSVTVFKSPQLQLNGNHFASLNLTSRRASTEGFQGDARLSAGSFSTVVEQATLLGKQGDTDFMLAQGYARSDGHRNGANGKLANVMGRFAYRLDDHWAMAVHLLSVDNTASDPGDERAAPIAVHPEYVTRATLASVQMSHQHGDWSGEVKVYRNQGDGDWLNQPAQDGDTLSHFTMNGLRWKESLQPWQGALLMAGVDYERLGGEAQFKRIAPAPQARFTAPDFTRTSVWAAFSQQLQLNDQWQVIPSAAIRHDSHNVFKSASSGQFGVSLVSDSTTLFANVSKGINYPGLETPLLASLIPPLGESWKQLEPETLQHAEAGIRLKPESGVQLDLSLFSDKVEHRYVFGFPPDVPPPPQFINLGAYRMKGLEASLRYTLSREWSAFAGFTRLSPDIDHLPYTPSRALTLGVNGKVGVVSVALDAQYQSEVWALNRARFAGAVNTEQVGSFTVANARVAYPMAALGKTGEIFVSIENMFDRHYGYRPGYPMPGRWAQLGASVSF